MKLFKALEHCVKVYSWNDNYCTDEVRERYTYCIIRRVGCVVRVGQDEVVTLSLNLNNETFEKVSFIYTKTQGI